eukprot:gene27153-biopygen17700
MPIPRETAAPIPTRFRSRIPS